jgi:hypothetical protein
MDAGSDGEAGSVWMTYGEIATARGIKRVAAIRLVQRHKWRKQAGNDGFARVLVPPDWTKPAERTPRDVADDVTDHVAPDVAGVINALQAAMDTLLEAKDGEIAGLREAFEVALLAKNGEIVSLREQFERGMARLQQAEAGRETAEARGDELRDRLDDLGGKLDGAQAELAAAQDQVEALTQAEAERRGRGFLARLSAALRRE